MQPMKSRAGFRARGGSPMQGGGASGAAWSLDEAAGERRISRRDLLETGAGLGLAALLAGCGSSLSTSVSASKVPLPRPNNPVKWPIYADNRPIASGLEPEKNATLQLFNWADYINEQVVKNFCRLYKCSYQITTFNNMSEAMAKLLSGHLKFDVFFPEIDVLGQLVETKLIRPLNHSYIPNIANTWVAYRNPFYDQGWQYTTPYSIYTTGMAWRKDKVNLTPSYNMPWEGAAYKGKVGILDSYRESISLALLRSGNLNLNTTDPAQIRAAGAALSKLAALTDVVISNNDYTYIATGRTYIQHAWSGDIASTPQYLPKGTPIDVIGYWFPANGKGPVANDLMVNLAGGSNPVLAHLFINYMLDVHNQLENYSYTGYAGPLTAITPQRLIAEKLLPPPLASTAVLPSYFNAGVEELELPPAAMALWRSTWTQFSKGV